MDSRIFVLALFVASALSVEIFDYDPTPNPSSVVVSGRARFTVLSPQLIRIEYSRLGNFEDRATLAVVQRNLPTPAFTHSTAGGILTITTSALELKYQIGSTFSTTTLSVTGIDSSSVFKSWRYGQTNNGVRNLFGTIRSLDDVGHPPLNCTLNRVYIVHKETLHCEWGLISRDGWALYDDSDAPVLDKDGWWAGDSNDLYDLYLFAHGLNYKQALYEYSQIGGKIALVPRYMTGALFSVWQDLNVYDSRKIIHEYVSRALPLDVFILDMNWHLKNDWTGYTYDPNLFPTPDVFMNWLHHNGLAVAANLHDDHGVASFEALYPEMAQAVGIDPNSQVTVPFSAVNQTIAYALEDIVLLDVEKKGMDFWWIDWQQGGTEGGAAGGKQNPTILLNKIRSTDHVRRGENVRGVVLGRWGGMGNHRYQTGFSGDVAGLTWQNLAYQPYFSLTASNVLYGFWSHDLMGGADSHEMNTRWLQWGAFSAVFRSHDRGRSTGVCADTTPKTCTHVKVWELPNKYFEPIRDAMQHRVSLVPYIYTAHRQAFETGISLIRPMYYEHPECDLAYAVDAAGTFSQYYFGDDMIVAPVVSPSSNETYMTSKQIFLPPGTWYEDTSGSLKTGSCNTVLVKNFDLTEVPRYIRAGAIIPTIPLITGNTLGNAARQYNTLVFSIYPGASSGKTQLYEDDAATVNYLKDQYAWTTATYTIAGSVLTFTLATTGSYPELPTSRTVVIRLINSPPPIQVVANGKNIPYSYFHEANTWSYEGEAVATRIQINGVSTQTTFQAVITLATGLSATDLAGVKGAIHHAILVKENLDEDAQEPGSQTNPNPGSAYNTELASLGDVLTYQAGVSVVAFNNAIKSVPTLYQEAVAELAAATSIPADRANYTQALMASAF